MEEATSAHGEEMPHERNSDSQVLTNDLQSTLQLYPERIELTKEESSTLATETWKV